MTGIAFSTAIISLLAAPNIAQHDVLNPAGQWRVTTIDSRCVMARQFGSGDARTTVAISPDVVTGEAAVALSQVAVGQRNARVTRVLLPAAKLAAMTSDSPITLESKDGQLVTLASDGLADAVKAADTCRASLRQTWGIDDASVAQVAIAATGKLGLEYWERPADPGYDGTLNVMTLLLAVDSEGRIADCRVVGSSGSSKIDRATCTAVASRAAFQPAKNSSGDAVKSWSVQRVRLQNLRINFLDRFDAPPSVGPISSVGWVNTSSAGLPALPPGPSPR